MHKNVFTLPVSFTGSYTEEEPNFPLGNNPVSQKVVWRKQKSEFQNLFKTQWINQVLFKVFNRIHGLFKKTTRSQDPFKIVRTMLEYDKYFGVWILKILVNCYTKVLKWLKYILKLISVFSSGGGGGLSVKTQPESRCPELLANFCDMLLRKTPYSKKLTSDEIQAKLRDVVSICNGIERVCEL